MNVRVRVPQQYIPMHTDDNFGTGTKRIANQTGTCSGGKTVHNK